MNMLKNKKDFKFNVSFVKNSYSAAIVVIVVAIAIFANLILQQMVGTSWKIDMSSDDIYDISEVSMELVDELEYDITFTVLADESTTDDMISYFIEKYTNLSDKITVEWIDPVLHPTALDTYNTTSDTVVIACGETGKSTIVAFTDILYTDEWSYYYTGTTTTEFDGDGLFTSAINQVTSMESYVIYNVTGHGESTFGTTISDLLTKNSVTVEELNLLTATEIPDDCDLLMFYAPESDITDDEKAVLLDYLEDGGNALLMLGGTDVEMVNLEAVLLDYGLDVESGYIADLDRAYQGNGYYIIPELYVTGDLADDITTESVLIINTRGFTQVETSSDTITVESFMTTSTNGLTVTEDSETSGTYVLGAVATTTTTDDDGNSETSRFTVYGSANIINEEVTTSFTSLENVTLFMNSVMANFDGVENISIESKVIEEPYNVVSNPGPYSALFIVVIPLGILVAGFVVWLSRRRR